MSEPIEDCGELHEGEKRECEFLVSSTDASVSFDAAEEVFDLVTAPIVASMESDLSAPRSFGRNTDAGALATQLGPKRIGIEAFVRNGAVPAQMRQQRFNRVQIVAWSCGQPQRDGPATCVHNGCQLRIDSAFGPTDGLRALPAAWIRAMLVQLDVRTVEVTQFALRSARKAREHPAKQPDRTPATETRIDRTPRSKVRRHVAPWHSGAQNVKHRRYHEPVVFARSTSAAPPAGFGPRTVNFFSPSHNGSGSSQRWTGFMRALRSFRPPLGSSDFEYTP